MRVEGVRELGLDTGHNSRAHSSEASVGLAQLILPSGLRSQSILPLFPLVNTLTLSFSLSSPPPLSSFWFRFNQQSPYIYSLSIIFRRQGCKRSTAPSICLILSSSVVTGFSPSRCADAIGRSGFRSRNLGRFLRAEAATILPRIEALQPMLAAP